MTGSGPKVGLVLGSGASRGWAHIGVIEALEEAQIDISMIVGVSAGAFIGAAYAGGGLEKVRAFALDMDWKGVLAHLDLAFPRSGFMEGKKVAELIKLYTNASSFEDLNIPLSMIATDMHTAEQVILDKGNLTDALRASMGVPGVMTPVHYEGRWLVDGGVVNPLPINVCRDLGADIVVAVDINSERISKRPRKQSASQMEKNIERAEKTRLEIVGSWVEKYGSVGKNMRTRIDKWFSSDEPTPHIFDVLVSSLNIMQKKIEEMNLKASPPDFLIQPQLGDMSFFDFDQAEHAIDEGYQQTLEIIPELKKRISAK